MRYQVSLGSNVEITITERKLSRDIRYSEYSAAPRMYVHVENESILDNLANRKRRPYNVYKTLIHGSLLGQIFDLGKLTWSQYAGCSCPCSPGFILPHQTINIGGHRFTRFDVWVKIKGAPAVNETKAPRVLAGAI